MSNNPAVMWKKKVKLDPLLTQTQKSITGKLKTNVKGKILKLLEDNGIQARDNNEGHKQITENTNHEKRDWKIQPY